MTRSTTSQATHGVRTVTQPAAGARVGSRARVTIRRLIIVALLVIPLITAEFGLRALIAAHRLPVAPAHQESLEVAWTNLDRAGAPEVLVLGDSLARMGIHPGTIETLAEAAVGRPVQAYNLSTPGAGFPVYSALIQQLGREGRLPKVAIIGISTIALQRPDRQSARALRSPFGNLVSDCGRMRALEDTLSCRLASMSALWRWRGQSDRLLEAIRDPVPTRLRDEGITLEEDGYASSAPFRPGAFDDQLAIALENTLPLANTTPDGRGYASLIRTLRAHDVKVVSVMLPYAPPLEDALEAREPGWLAYRSSLLEDLASRAGRPIVDIGSAPDWTIDDSHDMRHLSLAGAQRFTTRLWDERAVRNVIVDALRDPTGSP